MISIKKLTSTLVIIFTLVHPAYASNNFSKDKIKEIIVDEANRQGLEPALALAIAKVESDFNEKAISHAGAKGVMQIMPATAEQVFGVSRYKLYNPDINIALGVRFIKQLINRYDQRVDIALSHYNGGSAVTGKDGRLRIIPATKNYVNKVLNYRFEYQALAKELSVKTKSSRPNIQRQLVKAEEANLTPISSKTLDNKTKRLTNVARYLTKKKTSIEPINLLTQEQKSTYQKLEKIRALRVHNLMRNSKIQVKETPLSNKPAPLIVNANLPSIDRLKDKKAKVQAWESIY